MQVRANDIKCGSLGRNPLAKTLSCEYEFPENNLSKWIEKWIEMNRKIYGKLVVFDLFCIKYQAVI